MSHSTGFKEWQVVCDALASGRQSIILRKGGIHEGRQGFSFAHESFFLFPTRFHATTEQIREGTTTPLPEWQTGDTITITHYCTATSARTITDWDELLTLTPRHIYTQQTLSDRFHWQGKNIPTGSIHIAEIKTYALPTPWTFPYQPRYGGCRSWIKLDTPPADWNHNLKKI